MQHNFWRRLNREGIEGKHIAIVGYSHYRKDDELDHAGLTNKVMTDVLDNTQRGDSFFSAIPTYFYFENRAEFWGRVDFFNFVPRAFLYKDRFARASHSDTEEARDRFLNNLSELQPDRVFVFSRKAWTDCPTCLEESQGKRCTALKANSKDNWGTYLIARKSIRVCGFKHPLFAKTQEMQASVGEFLNSKL